MTAKTPLDELRKDHGILVKDIKALASDLRELGESEDAARPALDGTLRARLTGFREGMLMHFRREEEGLFPDARRLASAGDAKLGVAVQFFAAEGEDDLAAHSTLGARMTEMIELLAEAEAAGRLDQQSLTRLRAILSLCQALFERHAAKENDLVFPMIERALTPAQLNAVWDRLAAITPEQQDPRMRRDDGLTDLSVD